MCKGSVRYRLSNFLSSLLVEEQREQLLLEGLDGCCVVVVGSVSRRRRVRWVRWISWRSWRTWRSTVVIQLIFNLTDQIIYGRCILRPNRSSHHCCSEEEYNQELHIDSASVVVLLELLLRSKCVFLSPNTVVFIPQLQLLQQYQLLQGVYTNVLSLISVFCLHRVRYEMYPIFFKDIVCPHPMMGSRTTTHRQNTHSSNRNGFVSRFFFFSFLYFNSSPHLCFQIWCWLIYVTVIWGRPFHGMHKFRHLLYELLAQRIPAMHMTYVMSRDAQFHNGFIEFAICFL